MIVVNKEKKKSRQSLGSQRFKCILIFNLLCALHWMNIVFTLIFCLCQMPRKPRSTSQITIIPAKLSKIPASSSGEASKSLRPDLISSEGRRLANIEVSAGFNSAIVSQLLAPIGTPPVKTDSQADMRSQGIRYLLP